MPNPFTMQPPPGLAAMQALAGAQRRRFTPAQVAPFCEKLVEALNRSLPARFTITQDGDSALTIRVEIRRLELTAGGDDAD
jgi:hypothetical protein